MDVDIKKESCPIIKNKILWITICLLFCYTFGGFFLLPFLIERFLPDRLGKQLGCTVSVDDVSMNPYTLSVEVNGFRINDTSDDTIISFDRLFINAQSSSLFRMAFTFKEITLDTLDINVAISSDGVVNLARLGGKKQNEQQDTTAADINRGGMIRLLLQAVNLNGCRVSLTDNRQVIPAHTAFYPLNINL
jgi:hypothetical protein